MKLVMEKDILERSEITLLASQAQINGQIQVANEAHLYGKIKGEIVGDPGSLIILKENSLVEGKINADSIIIEGFVRGEIAARSRVWVTPQGKVIGSIKSPSLRVDAGALFEANVEMSTLLPTATAAKNR